jgi:phosphoglycerate dehydrogenase-like enzyme
VNEAIVVTLPGPDWLEDVQPMPAGVEGRVWQMDVPAAEALGEDAGRVAMVVWPYMWRPSVALSVAELPALRVVQTLSAGYDTMHGQVPDGVTLANAGGVHDASTAELAVGLALASLRGVDDAVRDAAQHRWGPRQRRSLADRRVLLLGVGGVGRAIADRLAPFEVDLTRVGSTARDDDRGHVHGTDELPRLLPGSDVVVLATPLSSSTRGMVGRRFLEAMPDGALLVNVGRGAVVDTGALLTELRRSRLQAALDVVDPEPLPSDSPLWEAPGLLLTPHVGGNTTAMRPRAVALLRDQVERLASGAPLDNLIPKEALASP